MLQTTETFRHETLLNLAFAGVPVWWLLYPYDTTSLSPEVLEEAWRSHPVVSERGATDSTPYRGLEQAAAAFAAPLPEPPGRPPEHGFGSGSLVELRGLVARHAAAAGLAPLRTFPSGAVVYL